MTVANGQPEVRFSKVGPHSFEGVSFEPKIAYFEKDISAAGNDDFWTIPAQTYVEQVFVRVETDVDGSGTVTIGKDADPDGFIDTTGFDASTAGNFATNIGTTVAQAGGEYFHASDVFRIAVGGTPTVGKISGFIKYYELSQMAARGIHHDL
jgi:hypothetical protein